VNPREPFLDRSGEAGAWGPISVDTPDAAPFAVEDRLCILLAEDVEENRLLIGLYLKNQPIDLVVATDGAEAVAAFARTPHFDLALMDIQMPNLDGLTATREIRGMERDTGRGRTPILALTAQALAEETRQIIEAGCDAHLTKPIRKADLLAAIAKHVRGPGGSNV